MDVIFLFLFFLIFWVVIATVLGGVIGERKGRTGAGVALGLFLGWVGVIIIAVMQPSEEVQRKRREEQGDIYLKALEAHGGGGGGSSASGVQIPARELIVVEAIKRDPTLVGVTDPEGLKRLADAITLIENEFRTREELRNATELIAKQEHEQELMQETARLTEESRQREQEAARAKAEEVERAKVARELQIAAMSPAKRWVVLHKPVSLLILTVVVLALIAGGYGYSTSLANQEAQRVAAACLLDSECNVGDTGPGGGIVFYDAGSDQPWGRYLEAGPELAPADWCDDSGLDLAGTKETIGAGAANTKLITAACGSGAANTVSDYDGGGKTDWFLPSKDELNELYEQRESVGGVGAGFYWSSSQDDAGTAWTQAFPHGNQSSNDKSLTHGVRPVRAF